MSSLKVDPFIRSVCKHMSADFDERALGQGGKGLEYDSLMIDAPNPLWATSSEDLGVLLALILRQAVMDNAAEVTFDYMHWTLKYTVDGQEYEMATPPSFLYSDLIRSVVRSAGVARGKAKGRMIVPGPNGKLHLTVTHEEIPKGLVRITGFAS